MKHILTLIFSLISTITVAQKSIELPLWPDGVPNSNGLSGEETIPYAKHISNVSVPTLSVYLPAKPNGMMVIACPGGGYGLLSMEYEGHAAASWFCTQGVAYAVLKYRMPNGNKDVPISDLQQAIRLVRSKAAEWHLNPKRIGVMGASAGGHLASTVATHYDAETRPDFQILLYPVVTMLEGTHAGSRNALLGRDASRQLLEEYSNELHVTADTPPAFIALSADDRAVSPANSLNYFNALQQKGVRSEMHIYPSGGHGWGFKDTFKYKTEWTLALKNWLREGLNLQ